MAAPRRDSEVPRELSLRCRFVLNLLNFSTSPILRETYTPCSFVWDLLNFLTSPAVFRDGRKVWADAANKGQDDVWCLFLGEGFRGTPALNFFSLGHDISPFRAPCPAMNVTLSLHPKGLGPRQAAKAWFLRLKKKAPWSKVQSKWKQGHSFFRPNEFQTAISNAGTAAMEAKTFLFSPK